MSHFLKENCYQRKLRQAKFLLFNIWVMEFTFVQKMPFGTWQFGYLLKSLLLFGCPQNKKCVMHYNFFFFSISPQWPRLEKITKQWSNVSKAMGFSDNPYWQSCLCTQFYIQLVYTQATLWNMNSSFWMVWASQRSIKNQFESFLVA